MLVATDRTRPEPPSAVLYVFHVFCFLFFEVCGRRVMLLRSLIQKLCTISPRFELFLFLLDLFFAFPLQYLILFEVWMSFPVPSVWIITRGGMEAIEISTTPITTARKRPRSFSISNFRLVRSWCRFRSGSA